MLHLPHFVPHYNLTECAFRDIKTIEKSKSVYGEEKGLLSLVDGVLSLKGKSFENI